MTGGRAPAGSAGEGGGDTLRTPPGRRRSPLPLIAAAVAAGTAVTVVALLVASGGSGLSEALFGWATIRAMPLRQVAVWMAGAGLVAGALAPDRAGMAGVGVGLGPVVWLVGWMTVHGPGNLWPVAVAIVGGYGLVGGVPGGLLGGFVARRVRG